jgi:hypothetical protein
MLKMNQEKVSLNAGEVIPPLFRIFSRAFKLTLRSFAYPSKNLAASNKKSVK